MIYYSFLIRESMMKKFLINFSSWMLMLNNPPPICNYSDTYWLFLLEFIMIIFIKISHSYYKNPMWMKNHFNNENNEFFINDYWLRRYLLFIHSLIFLTTVNRSSRLILPSWLLSICWITSNICYWFHCFLTRSYKERS